MAFSRQFVVTSVVTVLTWLLTFHWIMPGQSSKTVGTATSTATGTAQTAGSKGNARAEGNATVKRNWSTTCNLQIQCKNRNFHECNFSGCANESFLKLRYFSLSGTLPTQLVTMVNLRELYVRTKHLEAYLHLHF